MNIPLQPGRSISGTVLFEMAKTPDLSQGRFSVMLSPSALGPQIGFSSPAQAVVGADGRFSITGVMPGKYIVRANGIMKSSIVNGQDTLDVPLDFTGDRDITDAVLTVTDKTTEVSGALTDAAGKPALDYTIIAATADQRYWTPGSRRIMAATTGPDGHYIFRNLPPGDYLLAAVTDLENGGQYDPEFLRTLGGASIRVTLVEGARQTQDLRVRR